MRDEVGQLFRRRGKEDSHKRKWVRAVRQKCVRGRCVPWPEWVISRQDSNRKNPMTYIHTHSRTLNDELEDGVEFHKKKLTRMRMQMDTHACGCVGVQYQSKINQRPIYQYEYNLKIQMQLCAAFLFLSCWVIGFVLEKHTHKVCRHTTPANDRFCVWMVRREHRHDHRLVHGKRWRILLLSLQQVWRSNLSIFHLSLSLSSGGWWLMAMAVVKGGGGENLLMYPVQSIVFLGCVFQNKSFDKNGGNAIMTTERLIKFGV